ncbi:MAG: rod shape-determining protein MreD [Actinomycetes bacterium]
MRWRQVALDVALVVTALVVELVVLARLHLPGATPDLLLVVVVALALAHGPRHGMAVGFGAGLALDLAPPTVTPLGQWALVFCVVGFLVGRARGEVERSVWVPFLIVAIAAAGEVLGFAALSVIFGEHGVGLSRLTVLVVTGVAYDLVLTPFVLPVVTRLAARLEPGGGPR